MCWTAFGYYWRHLWQCFLLLSIENRTADAADGIFTQLCGDQDNRRSHKRFVWNGDDVRVGLTVSRFNLCSADGVTSRECNADDGAQPRERFIFLYFGCGVPVMHFWLYSADFSYCVALEFSVTVRHWSTEKLLRRPWQVFSHLSPDRISLRT